MGNSLAAWVNTLPAEHQYRDSLRQISAAYGALDNFEVVLADLMTCPPNSPAESLGVVRPYLLSDLKEAIRDQFDSIRSAPATLYDGLARLLRPGDTIITFNYDLGVERALRSAGLWDVNNGYGFSIDDGKTTSPVEVLKLHGSMNWRALLFGGMTGCFAGSGNSIGDRPVLFFRPDLEYLGYQDFVDPRCLRLDSAASLPAMIMPALPKRFYFETTYGREWEGFWDRLWLRAKRALASADEVVVIGYSMPTADERARTMLLDNANKTVRFAICCGNATAGLEQQFRDQGFGGVERIATTFESFLVNEAARGGTDEGAPVPHRNATHSRLQALAGKQGLLKIRFAGEVPFTFLSVEPPSDLPAEADDMELQNAITRSHFLVRFDEGTLIDGSDTKIISGHDISLIRGRY